MNKTNLQDQAVLVTGASSGIGYDIAQSLVAAGYIVFAGYRKEEDKPSLEAIGTTPVKIDITNFQDVQQASELVVKMLNDSHFKANTLRAIVNNAGISSGGPCETLSVKDYKHHFDVNFFAHIQVTQTFLPLLRRHQENYKNTTFNNQARIINITSMAAKIAQPFMSSYSATKHSLEVYTQCLRYELEPYGIFASSILPGAVKSKIWDKSSDVFDSIMASDNPADKAFYHEKVPKFKKLADEHKHKAIDPKYVSNAVLHCLNSKKPKGSYHIGRDAKIIIGLQKILPQFIFDKLIFSMLNRM